MNTQYTLTELINLIHEVEMLNESTLNTDDIAKMKYFTAFVQKIQNGEQFFLEPASPEEEPI